jgi:hypothetical protein
VFFDLKTRRKTYASFPIGIIPNLKYGISKNSKSKNKDAKVSLVDEHECLYTVFKQLIDIDKKGGFKVTILGKEVIARPWIHCIIGDIEGNNRLVAQYISNNGSLKRPNRHCKCENYLYAYADCDWVLWQEFIDAKERFKQLANNGQKTKGKEVMKSISRYEITTVWERGVPLADPEHGIAIHTPPELLHTVGVGICKYLVRSIFDMMSVEDAEKLDSYSAEVYYDLMRNSDRDYQPGSLAKGATDTTQQGAMQNIGNVFSLLCLSYTKAGHSLMTKYRTEGGDDKDISHPLAMFMAMIAWFHQENETDEVKKSPKYVGRVFNDLIEFFKREDGNGWDIPKAHGLLQFPLFMILFGCAANFDGKMGERSHIDHIKDNGLRTQRQMASFLQQVGERLSEQKILSRTIDGIINQHNDDLDLLPKDSVLNRKKEEYSVDSVVQDFALLDVNDQPSVVAAFSRSCQSGYNIKINVANVANACINWNYDNKNKQIRNLSVCFEVRLALAKIAEDNYESNISACGFTEAFVNFPNMTESSIVRCSQDYKGKPWYDFVSFKRDNSILAGKVCGIVQHGDTNKFLVHSTTRRRQHQPFQFMTALKENFHVKFTLGSLENDLVWVNVEDLVSPLCTFANYGENTKKDFIAILPRRLHGRYFSKEFRNSKFWTD